MISVQTTEVPDFNDERKNVCEVSFRENRAEFQMEDNVLRMSNDPTDTISPHKGASTTPRNMFTDATMNLGTTADNPPVCDDGPSFHADSSGMRT